MATTTTQLTDSFYRRLQKAQTLMHRGATEGERQAARAAYMRLCDRWVDTTFAE